MKGHSGRGSITRAFSKIKRLQSDEEYLQKHREWTKRYHQTSEGKKKAREGQRKISKILSEFANKRCSNCNKLLDYRTKSGFCRKHSKKRRKKK